MSTEQNLGVICVIPQKDSITTTLPLQWLCVFATWIIVAMFRFCSWLGSDPVAGHVGDFPRQSEGGCQRRLRPHQLEHGVHRHQNLPRHDGECSTGHYIKGFGYIRRVFADIWLFYGRPDRTRVKIVFLLIKLLWLENHPFLILQNWQNCNLMITEYVTCF